MFGTLATVVVAFMATNVDDLLLLAAWFADTRLRNRHVVIGQYLGIGTLVAVSAVAATVGVALELPTRWLGLLPIVLGLRRLWELRRPADETPMPAARAVGAVAAMTIANGGDNVAVYVPLIVAAGLSGVPSFSLVFAGMTAIWCALGIALVSHPLGQRIVARYGRAAVPIALIAIGVYVITQ